MHTPFAAGCVPTLQRPRMPDARPHTVHATALGDFGADRDVDGSQAEEDEQATPRASLAGLSILAEAAERELSRDDTAADMSEFLHHGPGSSSASQGLDTAALFGQHPNNKWLNTDPFTNYRPFPETSARSFVSSSNSASTSSEVPMVSSNSQGKQARSLGRRFSRSYKEKVLELRDSMSKHAPRMRRASTPHHPEAAGHDVAASQGLPAYCGGVAPPPLSPSKRNARYGDPRLKKFRSVLGASSQYSSTGDRKDTPAPPGPPNYNMPARPGRMKQNIFPGEPWNLGGGEGARESARSMKLAAAFQSPTFTAPFGSDAPGNGFDAFFAHQDLQDRRGRVHSNSAAADSGADLSRIDDNSCKDSFAGDSDDMGSPMEIDVPDAEPRRIDFVVEAIRDSYLPGEILLHIFDYLDVQSLCRARGVSSDWASLANTGSVWRTAFLRQYERQIYTDPAPIQIGGIGVGRPDRPKQKWEKMYKARKAVEKNWQLGPVEAGKAIYLSGHTDSVYCLQFDEEKIITGSRDRTIRVWDINTFQCIRVIGGPNVKPTLGPKLLRTVDYPSFHLATASVNGTAYGDNIYHTPEQWHDASILCLQYDEKILVTGSSDSDLLIWDIETYEPIKRLKRHTGGVLDVALDSKHIISCSKDSRIIVWDRDTYQPKGELTGHRGPVNAIQLRGKYLVSASGDGIARLWDIEELKLVKEFAAKERGLAAVEFSEDMKYVLAGGNDHITYKFNVETGQEVLQYTGHQQLVRSLWLDSANNRVVSGSYDLDLRVYDFETGREIWRAEEWTTSWMLAAKSDYRRIVATSQDGRILVIDFGLTKGGQEDGQPLEGVDLLRGVKNTNEVKFRNPWIPREEQPDSDDEED